MKNIFKMVVLVFICLISIPYINASKKNCSEVDKENAKEINPSISKSDVTTWSQKMWDTGNYDAFCTYSYSTTDSSDNPSVDYFFNICKSGDCHYYYAVGLTKDKKVEYYPISLKGYVGNPMCNRSSYLLNVHFNFFDQSYAKKFSTSKLSENKKDTYDSSNSNSCFQINQNDFISGTSYKCPSIAWGTIMQFDNTSGKLSVPSDLDGRSYCGGSIFAYNTYKISTSSTRQVGKNVVTSADIFNKTSSSVDESSQNDKLEEQCLEQGKLFDEKTKKCINAECSSTIKKEKDCLESSGYKWIRAQLCCLVPNNTTKDYIECAYQFGKDGKQKINFNYNKSTKDLKVNNYSTKDSRFEENIIWGSTSTTLAYFIDNSQFNNSGLFTSIFSNPEDYFVSNGELVCPNLLCNTVTSTNQLVTFTCLSSDKENCYSVSLSDSRVKVADGNLCPLLTIEKDGNIETITTSEELKDLLIQNDIASGNSTVTGEIEVPDGWKISDESMTCEELLGSNLTKIVNVGVTAIRVIGALATIIFGIVAYIPAVSGDNPELLKKANSKAIKMGIILIIILLLPSLVKIIGNIFDFDLTCLM